MSTVAPCSPAALPDLDAAEALLPTYLAALPRYTSYPTAPVWTAAYGTADFRADLESGIQTGDDVSVYVHVPFCRALCHFCACNRVVTRDEARPHRYLRGVERELRTLRGLLPSRLGVAQLHLGGGTPTHLDPVQLRRLFEGLYDAFPPRLGAEVSVEVDPRVTTPEHVEALRECGVNRVSMGVQDFDPVVQQAIHRVQSSRQVRELASSFRARGVESVNFDLIYGLPHQSTESFSRTLDRVIALEPDRIALYAYAHVTWVAKQQRGFERRQLPDAATRLSILLLALRRLLAAGFVYIGMDHFARSGDALARALEDESLHRNFMGYTTRAGLPLLGFGPSSISETPSSYAQSARDLVGWQERVEGGRLATVRGFRHAREDLARRYVISRIMCLGDLDAGEYCRRFSRPFASSYPEELASLRPMERDGLLTLEADGSLCLSFLGRLLSRNVAAVFDQYRSTGDGELRFSQSV